jgi:Na+-translocating ferredoxin:NAD+ oxidoreductase RnfD subunit
MLPDLKSIKLQLIIFLFSFACFLVIKEWNLLLFRPIAIALISALTFESGLNYFRNKIFQISESSLITGLIIGYVVAGDQAWWIIALASLIAILSKHFIRIKNKHIFNPAAFGIFLVIVLLNGQTQWSGTYFWYILIPFGAYFALKIRKIEVIAGYVVVSFLLFGTQALLHRTSLVNIFGYFSYFFIFILIIEPKTTPVKKAGKYLFGSGIAALIFILTEIGVKFDIELFSLLAMNLAVPFLNKLYVKKEV